MYYAYALFMSVADLFMIGAELRRDHLDGVPGRATGERCYRACLPREGREKCEKKRADLLAAGVELTFDLEIDSALKETRFVTRGGRSRRVVCSPEHPAEPTPTMADTSMPVPERTTGSDRVPPTQSRDKGTTPRDTGKSVRSSIFEEGDSSVVDRVQPFYRINENDLREHKIMRFPLTVNNTAVIKETLKIVDRMWYDDVTQNFIEYTNGVSVTSI